MPVLPGARALRRLTRIPITPTVPLPAKVRIRFLEPVPADALAGRADGGQTGGDELPAERIRALIQENLLEMVAERRSVWLG